MRCILFNKPYRVLSRFTDSEGRSTLADFVRLAGFYPAGRLDYDSEGLLLLTDDGPTQARVSHPRFGLEKTYWAQVEGIADDEALARLRSGVRLSDGAARAVAARAIAEPAGLWPRNPPIRHRAHIPTSWIEIVLDEGRNRQVRRMTAAVGLPTLRLVRSGIGSWKLDGLAPGALRELDSRDVRRELHVPAGTGATDRRRRLSERGSRGARSASRARGPARS
jgi:23S rRNA pseudouridine2457 synthase